VKCGVLGSLSPFVAPRAALSFVTNPSLYENAPVATRSRLGRAVSAAMEAISRQPEAGGQIQTAMIIGCALIEALTIYVLVIAFVLQGKITG
jgi:hypothetical protein